MSDKKFVVAVHVSEGRIILAVCDKSIHGKKPEDRNAVLNLGARFYKGKERDKASVEKLMLQSYTIHAVGKNSVAIAVKLGLAGKDEVKTVKSVPHVQVLML